ncbi:MAG: DUF262 domain-containing protein [Chitinophagales bacterium]
MQFFISAQKNLDDLFLGKNTYLIPSYQRLYSWEATGKSDRDSQVNVMWEDLIYQFETSKEKPYFMGSMVLIQLSDRDFEVVDGQQRLTTLSLLLVAIKCMVAGLANDGELFHDANDWEAYHKYVQRTLDGLLFNTTRFGFQKKEKKLKIERLGGYDYDTVLKQAMECEAKPDVTNLTMEQKKVVNRYFENRDYLKEKLQAYFLDNGFLTLKKAEELNTFVDFLEKKVTVISILCPSVEVAHKIFEILNNRGLPLSNKDLFRNFIIKELHKADIANPEEKWLHLDENYRFSSEFISRYVESMTAQKQRQTAFNDVKNLYDNRFKNSLNKKKIELFYENIEKNLKYYSQLELLSFKNIAIKHRINFLKHSGNTVYINNLLLALLRLKLEENEMLYFLKELELFVLYHLLKPSKRFQTKIIFRTIAYLNNGKFEKAKAEIYLIEKERHELKKMIVEGDIEDNYTAKLLIARYIWAKEIASPPDVLSVELIFKMATLEHIMPQKIKEGTNWQKDFSEAFRQKYTYKVGNMTLLTQSMNAQAKNYDFFRKKEIYKRTKLSLTHKIGCLESIDEKYMMKRHEKITNYLINDLGL